MITLKKLKWDNCFSYGADNEIDLDDNTVTQIIGTNGMGKSSIPLIIEEVLYNKNSKGQVQQVAKKSPNGWGLYDMHGNIWEWVADWYKSNAPSGNPVIDPIGPNMGSNKILRGGAWDAYNQSNLR